MNQLEISAANFSKLTHCVIGYLGCGGWCGNKNKWETARDKMKHRVDCLYLWFVKTILIFHRRCWQWTVFFSLSTDTGKLNVNATNLIFVSSEIFFSLRILANSGMTRGKNWKAWHLFYYFVKIIYKYLLI